MAAVTDDTRRLCQHQESQDDTICTHCGQALEKILQHAAEKGKHIAEKVKDSVSPYVTEEDILEAEQKLAELEKEEKGHLELETQIYEEKFRAPGPDSIDLLHEEQMGEHDVRREIWKRKEKASERLAYLKKKREEQLKELEHGYVNEGSIAL